MKEVTKELIKIYKPVDLDWLNYRVTRQNPLTYHHIIKREHGGLYTLDNGALLTQTGHHYLHIIEYKEIKLYEMLNKMFEIINKQRHAPTPDQREIIEYILNEFYQLHKNDKNSKGKTLIKFDYTQRF
jgi:hypothetical protein